MLLNEIRAQDLDLSEYDKRLMVNIHVAGKSGLNVKTLYQYEKNVSNLKSSENILSRYKFISKTDRANVFVNTTAGVEAMKRASMIDQNGNLISVNTDKYLYT